MGVILWGESPLYVNPVNVFNTLTKVLADGKGVPVRKGLKGWSEAEGEPQARATERSGNPECKSMSPAKVRDCVEKDHVLIRGDLSELASD